MARSRGRYVTALDTALVAALLGLASSGCIGATDRADFDAEVRARGGGLTSVFVTDSLDVIAADAGAGSWRDLEVLTLTATPARRSVTATVRDPDRPDFVDSFTVNERRIVSRTPVRDADRLPLDELVVDLGAVALDRVEDIAAAALERFDDRRGYVESVSVRRTLDGVRIDVGLASDRQTATATFDAGGTFVGIER